VGKSKGQNRLEHLGADGGIIIIIIIIISEFLKTGRQGVE
jgi:hypothetical protein